MGCPVRQALQLYSAVGWVWRLCFTVEQGRCLELSYWLGLQIRSMIGHLHWLGFLPRQDHKLCSAIGQSCTPSCAIVDWALGLLRTTAQPSLLCGAGGYVSSSCAGLLAWLSAWVGYKLCSMTSRHPWLCFLEEWDWRLCSAVG